MTGTVIGSNRGEQRWLCYMSRKRKRRQREGTRARARGHTHTHKHTNTHKHTHTHKHAHTQLHTHKRARARAHTHTHIYTHTHKPHTHTHTHIYTHTHKPHTRTQRRGSLKAEINFVMPRFLIQHSFFLAGYYVITCIFSRNKMFSRYLCPTDALSFSADDLISIPTEQERY